MRMYIYPYISPQHVCICISETERPWSLEDRDGEEGSRHVDIRDEEIGELVVDVVSKPIENVGELSEDGGGMRVGVPGGGD